MRKVIITADDYGMCAAVNAAIEHGLDLGTITSTNIMVNMPASSDATALRNRFPDVSIGLHWTLCQGRPITPPEQVPSLVQRDGSFHGSGDFRRRWIAGRIRTGDIRLEMYAQHRRFVELAGVPAYWNTHENTHVFPLLFTLFVALGRSCGLFRMRSHRRIVVPQSGSSSAYLAAHPLFWFKGLIIQAYSRRAHRCGTWMPRGLIYAPGYDKAADIAAILTSPTLPAGSCPAEFVVHPANRAHPELFGALVASRLTEYRTLTQPGLRERLASAGLTLCGMDGVTPS
jgi:predicted glycoside hydrolase/deacetylase ChbG (UPF0249 family)